MTPAKAIARLRRLAEDWRHEEARLCEQFGGVVVPQSMRARQIKDTQAIDAAVEMIERLEAAEKERGIDEQRIADLMEELNRVGHENDALRARIEEMERQEPVGQFIQHPSNGLWEQDGYGDNPDARPLYALPGAKGE